MCTSYISYVCANKTINKILGIIKWVLSILAEYINMYVKLSIEKTSTSKMIFALFIGSSNWGNVNLFLLWFQYMDYLIYLLPTGIGSSLSKNGWGKSCRKAATNPVQTKLYFYQIIYNCFQIKIYSLKTVVD